MKTLLLIKESQISQVNECSAFVFYGKIQESGFIEIIPLICTSVTCKPVPIFPPS